LNKLALRLAFIRPQNFDDVETKDDVRIVQQAQPGKAAFGHAQLLLSIHRFKRPAKFFAAAGLDFDEHESVPVPTDDVNLAAAAGFEISIKNFVAVTPQKTAGQFLAPRAPSKVLR
jgi:hypothetical protein